MAACLRGPDPPSSACLCDRQFAGQSCLFGWLPHHKTPHRARIVLPEHVSFSTIQIALFVSLDTQQFPLKFDFWTDGNFSIIVYVCVQIQIDEI